MKWLAICISVLLLASAIPSTAADGDGLHWNGVKLDRGSIANHLLTDQNGDLYSLHEDNADVNVVAFIFTSCPDVCPVITSNLVSVEKQIQDIDYQFISITVDPANDDPAALKEYSENFDADWPHLTGTQAKLQTVWDDFNINVKVEEIESHDDHDHDEMVHEMVVLYPDNTTSMLEVEMSSLPMENATGWNLTTAATSESNMSLNYSTHEEYGNSVSGINGIDSPDDWSWWWSLYLWNDTNSTWDMSNVGIDSVMIMQDTDHIAWAASNANLSMIPVPISEVHDTTVSHSSQTFILDEDWKPIVAYMGSNWDVSNFVEDMNRAAPVVVDDSEDVPGFTVQIVVMSLGLAIIAARRLE